MNNSLSGSKVGTESQPTELDPAADATFAVQLNNESNLRSVVLHYRPLNQTLDLEAGHAEKNGGRVVSRHGVEQRHPVV